MRLPTSGKSLLGFRSFPQKILICGKLLNCSTNLQFGSLSWITALARVWEQGGYAMVEAHHAAEDGVLRL
jgi:hypothetical protein